MLRLFISRVQCISKRENTQNVKSWAVGEQWKKGRTGIPPLRIWCKLKWYLYNRHVKWLERKGDQFWCESGLTWLKLDLNCAVRACVVSKISFSLLSSSFALTRESLNAIAAHFLFKILNMGISGFHTARLACLILRTRSQMIDVNCQNWPITGYTSSLYTRKRHCKQCLQAHFSVFPQSSRGFRATLFDPLFPYHLGALKWDSAENANKSTWLKLRKRASEK